MHQPSTGHLRSGCAALLAQSQRRNAASILQKFLLVLSLLSFHFPPSSFFGTLCVPLHISDISRTPPLFHLITAPSCLLLRSVFLLFPYLSPHFCTRCTIAAVFSRSDFLPLCDLSLFLAREQRPAHNPRNANIEQSFNLRHSRHRGLVSYIKWYSGIKVMAIA